MSRFDLFCLRMSPRRLLRRSWQWLTSPCRNDTWTSKKGEVCIASMSDAHLLNALFYAREHCIYCAEVRLMEEASHRGLPTDEEPEWLKAINAFYPDVERMKVAEALLRP